MKKSKEKIQGAALRTLKPFSSLLRSSSCLGLMFIVLILAISPGLMIVRGSTPTSLRYLVMFFEFEDLAHTKSIEQVTKAAVTDVELFYSQVSYGKIKVTGTVISRWIVLPVKISGLKVSVWNFDSNDMQMLDGYARNAFYTQPGINAAKYDIKFAVYAGGVWGHANSRYSMTFMNENYDTGVYRHELGHVIGLPDLYSYRLATEGKTSNIWVGPWDLMSWSGYGGLSSWSLMKLGWLTKEHIIRVSDPSRMRGQSYKIDALGDRYGNTYLLQVHVPGTEQDYYVETREGIGPDAEMQKANSQLTFGVVIYLVRSQGDPREGQIRVVDSTPGTDRNPARDLLDAPYNVGKGKTPALISKTGDFSIIVLKDLGYSYTVALGTADQGNRATEANHAIGQAEDALDKAETQGRTIGLQAARDELSKAENSYAQMDFPSAMAFANSALELAGKAVRPTTTMTIVSKKTTASTQPTGIQFLGQYQIYLAIVLVAVGTVSASVLVLRRKKNRTVTSVWR